MAFDFINTITESKLIKNKSNLDQFTLQDISDLCFLYFIALQILRSEPKYKDKVADYVEKTLAWGNFNSFRNSATDLYIFLHIIDGKDNESSLKELKNHKDNNRLLNKIDFKRTHAQTWLNNIKHKEKTSSTDKHFLLQLEDMLQIKESNYKAMRRLVIDWNDLSKSEKSLVMTRLLFALRPKASQSELLSWIDELSTKKDLEIDSAKNPEK